MVDNIICMFKRMKWTSTFIDGFRCTYTYTVHILISFNAAEHIVGKVTSISSKILPVLLDYRMADMMVLKMALKLVGLWDFLKVDETVVSWAEKMVYSMVSLSVLRSDL